MTYLSVTSPAAIRFLASIKEGRSLSSSARDAGVHKEVGYRWLRRRYLTLRREGKTAAQATTELNLTTARLMGWEADVLGTNDRHHLRHEPNIESTFWITYNRGEHLLVAAKAVGVGRSTAYRWIGKRFDQLRGSGVSVRKCGSQLRIDGPRARALEQRRVNRLRHTAGAERAAQHKATRSSTRYVNRVRGTPTANQLRLKGRNDKYWQLMRDGLSNADACRLLGMTEANGRSIRKRAHFTIPSLIRPPNAGRYLDGRERLQIADLLRLGHSMRQIATELGRQPSTISRELHRHRAHGRYLPATADHDARLQRSRPKQRKLVANTPLRLLVQRKLNRCWSPDEICGWMRKQYPNDLTMRLCPETIYRALLLRDGQGLHKRYANKLRTGRRIRKTRWQRRLGRGSRIINMTPIHKRPAEVETRTQAGHWEGDLIVGLGSVSAMVTLRERKTQYGVIVNLPDDHSAASVNAAVTRVFDTLPTHLKRTLTWDQGVEMSSHAKLTQATGVPVYFADRASPWQRGANENFNGLARQYFPKGTDLSVHTADHVTKITRELNQRPRKNLNYDTPAARLKTERNTPNLTAR
ncbi:IS30 family transposase [Subtercola boreus]|uniref:IS30 family transposase n=1 Tax=Subtercola boreus TaxID=120213 RepID=A0A3E0VAL0_9MICO|nr:IS30 family transposase [Subtercola boreus]RFA06751.1 IS30 family transposase [Subtercola boreus]